MNIQALENESIVIGITTKSERSRALMREWLQEDFPQFYADNQTAIEAGTIVYERNLNIETGRIEDLLTGQVALIDYRA